MRREVWKPVVGYEGWYSVSSLGRVRRDRQAIGTQAGKLLSLRPRKGGYVPVVLSKNGVTKQFLVHVLVCTAFHGPPPSPDHEVNHKSDDGDRSNNCEDNLEWGTHGKNIEHAYHVLNRRMGYRSSQNVI